MIRIIIYFILASALYSQSKLIDVKFSIESPNAKKLNLSGSFNNWSNTKTPLVKKDNLWQINIRLKPGYYYYRFLVDSVWTHDPGNDWKISEGGGGFNSIIKVGEPPVPVRNSNNIPLPMHKLPAPILEDNPDWINLYYSAWEILWNKIGSGNSEKGIVTKDKPKRSNKQIYQFNANLMAAFTMYAADIFPAMQSFDNLYAQQRSDGYIPGRWSNKKLEKEQGFEQLANPLLFPWLELKYYDLTGDKTRLRIVLPILVDYFLWINRNMTDTTGRGFYNIAPLGNGMFTITNNPVEKSVYIDSYCQQALAAMSIANIATVLEEDNIADDFYIMHHYISQQINKNCWDYETNFYYNSYKAGNFCASKHIDAFWTLLAEVSDSLSTAKLIEHLVNPEEFWRPHLVPSISADDENYDSLGYYRRGAVLLHSNYMLLKGLEKYDQYDLAGTIAANHLDNISAVYNEFIPDENSIAFEERFADGYRTIWESYSPELKTPAAGWNNDFYSRQDFAGDAGLAAVAMLIENIIGLEVNGYRNKIQWRITREDRHGIKNFNFRGDKIDLVCTPSPDQYNFSVKCSSPFILEIKFDGKEVVKKIDYGSTAFSIQRATNLQTGIN